MGKIIRINMNSATVTSEDVPQEYVLLGGRGLTSTIVAREVPATCHPLSAQNKLVIAPGLLTGTSAPCSGRLSIGCKSPLTNTIKESNVGGTAGAKLARLGITALTIEGTAKDGETYILNVTKDRAELVPNGAFTRIGNYAFANHMRQKYGDKVSVISTGPAGEMKLSVATIAVTDMDGRPSRHAGRGGTGAVMGSKGLKGIVIDDAGTSPVQPVDREGFKAGQAKILKALAEHPVTSQAFPALGTAMLVNVINTAGAFPTRNFSVGQFEGAEKISGEAVNKNATSRPGGKMGHPCMPGCVIKCSNVYVDEHGEHITSGLEYETIWANGANCGIDDLDAIARIDRLCDDFGLDTMETGAAIAVAMAAGVKSFGDAQGAIQLIREIAEGTPLGRILGSGAEVTGKVYGIERVPTVKGQAMAAYDPRALKGNGVTYATSPMGADHTAANVFGPNLGGIPGLSAEGQAELSKSVQTIIAAHDYTGLCTFVTAVAAADIPTGLDGIVEMLSALLGANVTIDSYSELGKRILAVEREFNARAGFSAVHDRLPLWMTREPLPPHHTVFDVSESDLDSVRM